MAIHGNTWLHMAIHGYTWQYMAIHGYTWQYMAIHGKTWLYMAIHGYTYSLRHRKCGVRGFIHELFVSKPERARYERVRAFDTNNE